MAWKVVLAVVWVWTLGASAWMYQNQDGPIVPSQRNANRYPDKQGPLPAQTSDDNEQVWPGVAPANQQATPGAQGASKADKKRRKQAGRNANRSKKWNNRLAEIKAQFPELTENQAGIIANHGIFVGMTAPMLRASWRGFLGAVEPDHINSSVDESGLHQQAIYKTLSQTIYVYFENGIVCAFQIY